MLITLIFYRYKWVRDEMMFKWLFKGENRKINEFKKMIEKSSQLGVEKKIKLMKTKYNEEVLLYHPN